MQSHKLEFSVHVSVHVSNQSLTSNSFSLFLCTPTTPITRQSSKSYAKKELKTMPFIGWSFHFGEFIFVQRNWEKDSKIMAECLNNLKEYKDKICLLLFAEGTRYTKTKYEEGCKFAQERGLTMPKHHLMPRTRGFTYTVQHLKNDCKSVFNAQLEFETEGVAQPTFTNVLKGKPLVGHLYLERIPMDQVPTASDEELHKFLFELYEKKDRLVEEFKRTKTFESKYTIETEPRLVPLLNMLFWLATVTVAFFALIYVLIAYKFYTLLASIVTIFALISIAALVALVRSTKAVRGSAYGTAASKDKTS